MARFKSRAPNELLYSLFAFIIVTIAVHAVYVTVVRPKAATGSTYDMHVNIPQGSSGVAVA